MRVHAILRVPYHRRCVDRVDPQPFLAVFPSAAPGRCMACSRFDAADPRRRWPSAACSRCRATRTLRPPPWGSPQSSCRSCWYSAAHRRFVNAVTVPALWHRPRSWVITEDALESHTDLSSQRWTWAAVQRVEQRPEAYLFWQDGPTMFDMHPWYRRPPSQEAELQAHLVELGLSRPSAAATRPAPSTTRNGSLNAPPDSGRSAHQIVDCSYQAAWCWPFVGGTTVSWLAAVSWVTVCSGSSKASPARPAVN